MSWLPLLIAALILSLAGSAVYLQVASRHGPYALPNFRSLHQQRVPRGGGIVVALCTTLGFAALYVLGWLTGSELALYAVGGAFMALAGFVDDRVEILPKYKLVIQTIAAVWVCHRLHGLPSLTLGTWTVKAGLPMELLAVVGCIWFYNLYNFIDGIDGLAASATVFIASAMGLILAREGQPGSALVLGLLATSAGGFLFFNWAPAKMFLGDAGTNFIAYALSVVALSSIWRNPRDIWLWLIVGAVYLGDTTATTTTRALTRSDWHRPHRSHAYQNLARIWGNHARVTTGILMIDAFWILPLLALAYVHREYSMLATLLAYAPVLLLCVKWGPLFENK